MRKSCIAYRVLQNELQTYVSIQRRTNSPKFGTISLRTGIFLWKTALTAWSNSLGSSEALAGERAAMRETIYAVLALLAAGEAIGSDRRTLGDLEVWSGRGTYVKIEN